MVVNPYRAYYLLFAVLFLGSISWYGLHMRLSRMGQLASGLACDMRTVSSLIHRKLQREEPMSAIRSAVARSMDWIPPQPKAQISLRNPFQKILYHRFASYQTFPYFDNESEIRNMSGATIHGKPFYPGSFDLIHRRSLDGIRTIFKQGNDAVYTLARNHDQKLIVLSWRGSHVIEDYWADLSSRRNAKPDSRFFNQSACIFSGDKESKSFFVGKGFQDTLPKERVLKQIVTDLIEARRGHMHYDIVITGYLLFFTLNG